MAAQLDFWTFLQDLSTDIPFTHQKIAHRLRLPLHQVAQNAAFVRLEGGPLLLADGVIIHKIELRVPRRGDHPGLLVLSLAGHPITHQDKRVHYPEMTIFHLPPPEQVASEGTATTWIGTIEP